MVGKGRYRKRQRTLSCAFKPKIKNLPKDGVSNRNTSSCLLETINIVPYLICQIILQPLINILPHLSGIMVPSCNMRIPGRSPNPNAFFSTKGENFKIYWHIAYPPQFSRNTHGKLIGLRNHSIMWKHYVSVHAR
jgi:hypothetical protein